MGKFTKKETAAALKKMADMLPEDYCAVPKTMLGSDILKSPSFSLKVKAGIHDPTKKYTVTNTTRIKIDHFKRLKRAYKKSGDEGLNNYLNKYRKPKEDSK